MYACYICDDGFDTDDDVKKHKAVNHKDILIQIKEKMDEDEDDNCNKDSYGGAWLAKMKETS